MSPPSRVTRTLDGDAPPVTAHAFFLPSVATQVPLDAKKDSPGSAAGSLPAMLCHVCPFVVRTTGNCPFTESLWAKPRVGVQKAKQSKNAAGSWFWNCCDHVVPPSVVL